MTIGLGGVVVSTSVANAAPTPSVPIDTSQFVDGRYVVQLKDDAAALYTGGIPNLQRTSPTGTQSLDEDAAPVVAYSDYLENEQQEVADSVGADIAANLTLSLNGFVADLSADQALELARDGRVLNLFPEEFLQVDGSPSNEYLDVEGMWDQVGGEADAGSGVVVGVLDTGIAPENPLFAGEPLGTEPGSEPYLDGDTITYTRGDGGTFTGTCETGPQFTSDMCSTKIIGAQFFLDGFGATRIAGSDLEVPSPRDLDGHGSHTASTAAGNYDVPVTTQAGQDIGTMSGVAPEARIAVYKVCWTGNPDATPPVRDGCAATDLVQAIEAATADGVDVINFSIGGGAATSVITAYDEAFLGAAAAGIFVSASAGNSGPGASTLDHASPWYATVANTTIPNYEATATFSAGSTPIPGASVTVDMDPEATPLSGELVYAGDIPAEGASVEQASLCFTGAIDAEAAAGKIVVCDRGQNDRVAKSATVAAAGGIGMILTNVVAGSIDLDDHSVPTIHVDAQYRAQVLAAVAAGATVTFTPGNTTGIETPAPIVAASSSRGPALADGSDVIKPDIAAPGTGIIAAGPNAEGEEPGFIFLSGTSMAAPHVAGLAAFYLGEFPNATPSEIKSALMTTATDTVNADGSTSQDWWAQGAGFVNTADLLDAGVYYASGTEDWYGYLRGLGYVLPDTWVGAAIDPSDLNIPSIGVGALPGSQTVTRTLTALEPGSYSVTVDAPEGTTAVVSPTVLDFTAAGQELSYSVTFTTTTAPLGAWTTGSLTWTSAEHTARSPIALFPVALDAPTWVEGTGTTGSTPVTVLPGETDPIGIVTTGLSRVTELLSGEGVEGDAFETAESFSVPEGSAALYFELDGEDGVADLDLLVGRLDANGNVVQLWQAATPAASETLLIENPSAGEYIAAVDFYSVEGDAPSPFTLDQVSIGGTNEGQLTATPSTLQPTIGVPETFELSWRGLDVDASYIGLVEYSTDDSQQTFVRVTTGDATIPAPERISGANRYETAVAASQLGYPEGADVVYVASGVNYPDGLAAGPAAAVEGGPLLLTDPAASPDVVVDEIERLAPSRIVIVGGTGAISASVETEMEDLAETVDRISGADRYETSRLIAEYAFGEGAGSAFIATGRSFPDALTAGAAGGAIGAPVLLVDGLSADLDAATGATLDGLGVTSTLVAGGTAAVSNGIYADLINDARSPQRLSGSDRFLTGVYVNQAIFGPPVSGMYIASGLNFPDALSASALAGAAESPLYVVQTNCVSSEIISESLRLGQPDVYLMGGTAALGAGVESYTICG
ncbi:cell wall-binding repeat-containing protein [Agrococcus sp. SGAir0287]|uniref:cell wall-binding repeat-containing protein n=1 Tax=Agrococcus sp. SGAir0287 TaxID=2070347 RepID=UPI0010CD514B|nr:cell wall-binding repeat-containing protein [Agrococcus sp. SGAir0287]QCR18551.1 serine protease [Agrococcus sp. SGAir0287]